MKYLFFVILLVAVIFAFYNYLNTPIVAKSYKTQKCVAVFSRNNEYKCENLPRKYELVWYE